MIWLLPNLVNLINLDLGPSINYVSMFSAKAICLHRVLCESYKVLELILSDFLTASNAVLVIILLEIFLPLVKDSYKNCKK